MTGTEPIPQPEPTPAPDPQLAAPAEPAPTPQPAQPAVQPTPQPAAQPQPAAPAGTVNAHKYQRDIAKVEAERDAAKAELEGYKGLEEQFNAWKAEQEEAKTKAALKNAGCHDVVAASARLEEFEGDIEKLKEAAPYLFTSTDNSKSTGGTPKGAPEPENEREQKYRSYFGLDSKEK